MDGYHYATPTPRPCFGCRKTFHTTARNPRVFCSPECRIIPRTKIVGDCWEWTGCRNAEGYGNITFEHRSSKAHRESYRLFVGPIPDGLFVLHKCDNPPCVNPAHLFLGTNADNMADKKSKGRGRGGNIRGSAHYRAKINEGIVLDMRSMFDGGMHRQEIYKRFPHLSRALVDSVIYRERWKHV